MIAVEAGGAAMGNTDPPGQTEETVDESDEEKPTSLPENVCTPAHLCLLGPGSRGVAGVGGQDLGACEHLHDLQNLWTLHPQFNQTGWFGAGRPAGWKSLSIRVWPQTVRQQKTRLITNRDYCINWWRRRESNPRPPIVPGSFYMLSRRFSFAPEDFHWQNS